MMPNTSMKQKGLKGKRPGPERHEYAQTAFVKSWNGEKQVGIALRGLFHAPFGLAAGQTVRLREQPGPGGPSVEYSADGGLTWGRLPPGRPI